MEQRDYVRRLLDAYRVTPGTCGAVRRPDRVLAAQLHQAGVPLEAVREALDYVASNLPLIEAERDREADRLRAQGLIGPAEE